MSPLVALLLKQSPSELLAHLSGSQVRQAISLSLVTSLLTTAITVVAGTPLAFLLARRSFRGRTLIDTLVDLPMVLPPAVAGVALLVMFGRAGLLGRYLQAASLDIAFTPVAVVLAQTFVAAPFYVKAAAGGLAAVDSELEQSAELDGAGRLQVLRYVTVPLA
ncbi:MAG: ABC transporter permease subunit, partial [Chloroflexota bacterium]|nr:ABC transporter permease subunit [Chloroflexota bacterium]